VTPAIVVMGPSGCGKSTLGAALAARLGVPFIEGDALHPPENLAKMAAGVPLDDADRAPFLDAVGAALAARPEGAVASCSALRRTYRDRLRARAGRVAFVLPLAPRAVLAARLAGRAGHFMPASLLDSQMATLERPGADELACVVDAAAPPDAQVAAALSFLRDHGAHSA
jgi:carbohydrate kinase (thermoresistant glucokinase family)